MEYWKEMLWLEGDIVELEEFEEKCFFKNKWLFCLILVGFLDEVSFGVLVDVNKEFWYYWFDKEKKVLIFNIILIEMLGNRFI